MRTFIAIKIEPDDLLLQILNTLKQELSEEAVKWVDKNNYHLTLKFLGETSDGQLLQIKDTLATYTELQKPVSFAISGLGFFKSRGMPRVIYADIKEGESLQQLAKGIEMLLIPFGFHPEERPFNPHLTLARIKFLKDKKRFYHLVESNQYVSDEPVTVREIIYYQSHLNPGGPVYRELAKYSLTY